MLHLLQQEQVQDMKQQRRCHISMGCHGSAQGQALCRQRSGQLPSAVTLWSEAQVTNAVFSIALGSVFMGNEPDTHI